MRKAAGPKRKLRVSAFMVGLAALLVACSNQPESEALLVDTDGRPVTISGDEEIGVSDEVSFAGYPVFSTKR